MSSSNWIWKQITHWHKILLWLKLNNKFIINWTHRWINGLEVRWDTLPIYWCVQSFLSLSLCDNCSSQHIKWINWINGRIVRYVKNKTILYGDLRLLRFVLHININLYRWKKEFPKVAAIVLVNLINKTATILYELYEKQQRLLLIIINATNRINNFLLGFLLHFHRRRHVQRAINCGHVHLAHIGNVIRRQRLQVVLLGQFTTHSVLVAEKN